MKDVIREIPQQRRRRDACEKHGKNVIRELPVNVRLPDLTIQMAKSIALTSPGGDVKYWKFSCTTDGNARQQD